MMFQEDLKRLKKLRELETQKKEERDKLLEGLPIFKELDIIKQEKEALERDIRQDAVEAFKKTGEKRFLQVGIRITTNYIYEDQEALTWAKKHDLCLALDKTAFKKQLKVQPLDFVKTEEVPTATIPTQIKDE